jgi:transposase
MPAQRLTMRRVRELLRLNYGAGTSVRAIARELGVSRSMVKEYPARAAAADLVWPLPEEFTDTVLEERLFCRQRPQVGDTPAGRTGLGSAGRRDVAAGRQSDDAVGGVGCRSSSRIQHSRFCEL